MVLRAGPMSGGGGGGSWGSERGGGGGAGEWGVPVGSVCGIVNSV